MDLSMGQQILKMSEYNFYSIDSNVDALNGFLLNNVYLPKEVLAHILQFLEPNEVLECSLVCKNWFIITRSSSLWSRIYSREFNNCKSIVLPWYLYYSHLTKQHFTNMLANGCGQHKYTFWDIMQNGGNKFSIEDPPNGAEPLPVGIPDFEGNTSCFATSYGACTKRQTINVGNDLLLTKIINNHKPYIYVSEWVAARFDCASKYKLIVELQGENNTVMKELDHQEEQWAGAAWKKMEITISDYPVPLKKIIFMHSAQDRQFWAGHYGMKMTGSVVKLVFNSIKPDIENMI